jgi:hypothetical protein
MESRAFSPTAVASDGSTARRVAQVANRRCAATRGSRLAFVLARASGLRRRGWLCPTAAATGRAPEGVIVTRSSRGRQRRHRSGAAGPVLEARPIVANTRPMLVAGPTASWQEPCHRWCASSAHNGSSAYCTGESCSVTKGGLGVLGSVPNDKRWRGDMQRRTCSWVASEPAPGPAFVLTRMFRTSDRSPPQALPARRG